jgi:hypothetical protein
MRAHHHFTFAIVTALTGSILIAGCADTRSPVEPTPRTPRSAAKSGGGVTSNHVEIPVTIDVYVSLPCLEEPIRLVVWATDITDWTTTPSGISSARNYFDVDRSKTYTVYKGVTYYVAQGRPGHDAIGHILEGPGGLYVTSFVEPNFESSATGERLNLQLVGVTVIGRDGTVRVDKFTGQCPAQAVR